MKFSVKIILIIKITKKEKYKYVANKSTCINLLIILFLANTD